MLSSARYDVVQANAIRDTIHVDKTAASTGDEAGLLAAMGYDTNEVTTIPANEFNTHLKVRAEHLSLGTLLGTGQAGYGTSPRMDRMIVDELPGNPWYRSALVIAEPPLSASTKAKNKNRASAAAFVKA